MNESDLKAITLKILEYPKSISSSEFLQAYNAIFLHCTKSHKDSVIKGKVVYDLLISILTEYFKSLRPISSLCSFYKTFQDLEESLDLISRVYVYLSRFYIKMSIDERDGYLVDLKTLSYSLAYKYFFEHCVKNIQDFIIYEIDNVRVSKKYDTMILSKSVGFLKKLLFYSDNEQEYLKFLEKYYKSFYEYTSNCNIRRLYKRLNNELNIAKKIINLESRKDIAKVSVILKKRFEEFLQLIFGDFSKLEAGVRIIYYTGDEYLNIFMDRYVEILRNDIEDINDIRDLLYFYTEAKVKISSFIISTENLVDDLDDLVKDKLLILEDGVPIINEEIRNIVDFVFRNYSIKIDKISDIIYNGLRISDIFDGIFNLINLSYQKELILEKAALEMQNRLLHYQTALEIEKLISDACVRVLGLSYSSKLSISVQDFMNPIHQNFGLSNQEFDCKTELRLLTKGFWKIQAEKIKIHTKLEGICNILQNQQKLKYPKSEMSFNFRASPVIASINDINFRMSSDKINLLFFFSEKECVDTARKLIGDVNFDENLVFLKERYFLVVDEENYGVINYNFDKECAELIIRENKVETVIKNKSLNSDDLDFSTCILDFFKFVYKKDKRCDSKKNDEYLSLKIAIESAIVYKLKWCKSLKKTELLEYLEEKFSCKHIDLSSIIEKLGEKGYLTIQDGIIKYIP